MTANIKRHLSHELIESELTKRGYDIEHLNLGQNFTCYTANSGRAWFTRDATLSYPFVSGSARIICKDKELSQQFASSQGVIVADTIMYPDQKDQLNDFLSKHKRLVVKPLDSFGARGITLNIESMEQLNVAVAEAQTFSTKVLVQRQFNGEEIRVTVSDGEVLIAINRRTPRVIGDGRLSIAELIKIENEQRSKLHFEYLEYPQLSEEILPSHWFLDQRIPDSGEIVELSRYVLAYRGGTFHNITDELHEDYKSMAIALTNKLNPDFLAVDFLVKDYTEPATEGSYMLLEFTTSPALYVYYSVRTGKPYDMADHIADMVDEYCKNS